jgi:uncharacterized protein YjbI with pentapeptide repeats
MANEEHLDMLKQGKKQWNTWRKQHPEMQPDLSGADLDGADLSNADLRQANMNGTCLYKANLSGANLSDTSWFQADLCETNLSEAYLGGANLLWATLNGAKLSNTILHKAKLSGARLSGADMNDAYLFKADLSGANLSGANLCGANLGNTNLAGASLSKANLREADLSFAILDGADLSSAKMRWTTIADMDLRKTKGLAEIQHEGPSPVALYSVQLPQDGSALHFLRGAGVPDEWIDDYCIRMMHPIQYYSCFIGYSSKDKALASRLHADLQDHGVRCWIAQEDLKTGDKIRARIDEAIHLQEKLLLLLSEHSIASTWVENEVEAALEREDRQQREVLFPVRLDEAVIQTSRAWAATLRRTRHIGDFTCWTDPQAYQQAFTRLLRDLKKADEPQNQEMKQ